MNQEFYSSFGSLQEFQSFKASRPGGRLLPRSYMQERQRLWGSESDRSLFVAENSLSNQQTCGFKVRQYRSGEMTGAQFLTGSHTKIIPPSRQGMIVTGGFTQASRVKIRRAAENALLPLQRFITLTFDPSHLWKSMEPVEIENALQGKDEHFNVGHVYAKKQLCRFLNTMSVTYKRRDMQFSYLWVAELQPQTGFIHFHILTNLWIPKDYVKKIWGLGRTRIDYIKNTRHAVNYMRKYITKDETSPIQGNRYNISSDLRETMQPIMEENIVEMTAKDIKELGENPVAGVHELIDSVKQEIEKRGGIVLDFGFSLPAPRRTEKYKDKKTGEIKETRGVPKNLAPNVLQMLEDHYRNISTAPF